MALRAARRVSPFQALLVAHVRMGWNRVRRGLGRRSLWGMAAVLGVLVTATLPMFAAYGLLGYLCGHGIDKALAPVVLGTLLTLTSLGFGWLGGVLGGTRQLTWDAYRSYPIPFRVLFLAEIFAGLGDTLALGFVGLLLCLAAPFLWQRPLLLPLLVLLLVQATLWMLFLQQLIGALAAAAVKRLRVALLAVVLAAWVGFSLLGSVASRIEHHLREDDEARLRDAWHALRPLLELLPPVHAAQSMALVRRGAWLSAAAHEVPMLAVTLMLGFATYAVLRREARPPSWARTEDRVTSPRGFWLPGPVLALARLHARHLFGSMQGRFGLAIPLITVVLVKGPLASASVGGSWVTPASVTYLALAAAQLQFNQFGFDGQGIKTLLLLPIRTRDILLGKALALAAYGALQYALLFALFAVLVRPSAADLTSGALLGGSLLTAHVAEGHWLSALYPRPLSFQRFQGSGLSGVQLLTLGLGMLNGAVFGGIYAAVVATRPSAVVPAMGAVLVFVLVAYRALLPRAARFVSDRREKLVDVLG